MLSGDAKFYHVNSIRKPIIQFAHLLPKSQTLDSILAKYSSQTKASIFLLGCFYNISHTFQGAEKRFEKLVFDAL